MNQPIECPHCGGIGEVTTENGTYKCVVCNGDKTVMTDLTTLIDKRYELEQQKDELQRQIDDVSHEITVRLLEEGKKQEYGTTGIGYAVTSTTKYEYRQPVYDYLQEKGLLDLFLAAPKITRTKLDSMLKEGSLTYEDMAFIEKHTIAEQSPYSLRKVVNKEATVI